MKTGEWTPCVAGVVTVAIGYMDWKAGMLSAFLSLFSFWAGLKVAEEDK